MLCEIQCSGIISARSDSRPCTNLTMIPWCQSVYDFEEITDLLIRSSTSMLARNSLDLGEQRYCKAAGANLCLKPTYYLQSLATGLEELMLYSASCWEEKHIIIHHRYTKRCSKSLENVPKHFLESAIYNVLSQLSLKLLSDIGSPQATQKVNMVNLVQVQRTKAAVWHWSPPPTPLRSAPHLHHHHHIHEYRRPRRPLYTSPI